GFSSMKELEHEKAKKERACIAAGIRSVVAEKFAVIARNSSFKSFDWNSVDVGNSVID
ncbi:hypothetical protein M406DRAFT_251023, partial [Cryphonectria parasitica EP155]